MLINAAAAGVARCLEEPVASAPSPNLLFARRIACVGTALFFLGLQAQGPVSTGVESSF